MHVIVDFNIKMDHSRHFTCIFCQEHFSNLQQVKAHQCVSSTRTETGYQIFCKCCGEIFTTMTTLTSHVNVKRFYHRPTPYIFIAVDQFTPDTPSALVPPIQSLSSSVPLTTSAVSSQPLNISLSPQLLPVTTASPLLSVSSPPTFTVSPSPNPFLDTGAISSTSDVEDWLPVISQATTQSSSQDTYPFPLTQVTPPLVISTSSTAFTPTSTCTSAHPSQASPTSASYMERRISSLETQLAHHININIHLAFAAIMLADILQLNPPVVIPPQLNDQLRTLRSSPVWPTTLQADTSTVMQFLPAFVELCLLIINSDTHTPPPK